MAHSLDNISIKGFKSIRSLDNFTLNNLNILVGANGAGKSNFVSFFRMLRAMAEEGLAAYVTENGGADGFFFGGPQETSFISARLKFGKNEYEFDLTATVKNDLMVRHEIARYSEADKPVVYNGGRLESQLISWKDKQSKYGNYPSVEAHIYDSVSSWIVYHFHDTGSTAPMRRDHSVRNKWGLMQDAGNIAAFLLHLKKAEKDVYRKIVEIIQIAVPFLDDFILKPEKKGQNEVVRLEWRQKGSSYPFQPWQLSDGSIRFICLVTSLLQPNPPATIIIDEPELGLHPFALEVLSGLLQETALRTQVIVSTQSAALLNNFQPAHIVVVDREKGASVFKRLDAQALSDWLKDFTLGELWQKNVFDGGPAYEFGTPNRVEK